MAPRKTLMIGAIGTVITALCCFTPVLVIALAAIGAGGMAVYLDFVLLPLLAFFMVLTVVALLRRRDHG